MSEWTEEREAEVRARWFPKPPKDAVDLAAILAKIPASQYQEPVFKISMNDIELLTTDFFDALEEIARLRHIIRLHRG